MIGRPVQNPFQVPQRLNAGAQLNAEEGSVIIQRLQLVIGIAAAFVAEEGLPWNLIGVLRVHHAQIQTHQRHFPEEEAQGIGVQNGVAGAVEHDAGGFKPGCFPDGAGGQRQRDQAHGPVEADRGRPDDCHLSAVAFHGKPLSVDAIQRDSGIAQGNAQVLLKLGQSFLPMFRWCALNMKCCFHR